MLGNTHLGDYAHFQPGSIKVKVGQKVTVGQTLGLLYADPQLFANGRPTRSGGSRRRRVQTG